MQRAVVFWHAAFSTWKQMSVFSKLSFLKLNKNGAKRGRGKAVELGRTAASGSGSAGALRAACSLVQVSRELFLLALTQPRLLLDTDVPPAAPSNAAPRIQCHTQSFVVHLSLLGGLATDESKCSEKHEMQGFIWYFISVRVAAELPLLGIVVLYTTANFFKANSR